MQTVIHPPAGVHHQSTFFSHIRSSFVLFSLASISLIMCMSITIAG